MVDAPDVEGVEIKGAIAPGVKMKAVGPVADRPRAVVPTYAGGRRRMGVRDIKAAFKARAWRVTVERV